MVDVILTGVAGQQATLLGQSHVITVAIKGKWPSQHTVTVIKHQTLSVLLNFHLDMSRIGGNIP